MIKHIVDTIAAHPETFVRLLMFGAFLLIMGAWAVGGPGPRWADTKPTRMTMDRRRHRS